LSVTVGPRIVLVSQISDRKRLGLAKLPRVSFDCQQT
jgi:hypothetical protein